MWQLNKIISNQMNRRLGQPAINIYKDNDTGKPKGVATLSYEEPICAKAAVEHFDGMWSVTSLPFICIGIIKITQVIVF